MKSESKAEHEAKPKFTEQELKSRYIGKMIDSRMKPAEWKMKRNCYCREEVWEHYTTLRDSFRPLLIDATGYRYNELADKCTQIMMDAYLIRRANGENVHPPKAVVPENAVAGEKGEELFDPEIWADKPPISENEMVRWVFENLKASGLSPEDAPSQGAWTYLMEVRTNQQMKSDLINKNLMKLITKEDAEKGGKLADNGEDTIKLLERLQEAME